MSHFTTIQTKLVDAIALEQALSDLKYRIARNAQVRGWRGQITQADLVVQATRNFDIGFIRSPQGSFDTVADWWGVKEDGGIEQAAFLQQLMQRYAYRKVTSELQQRGFVIAEEATQADQSIRLLARKW